MNPESEFQVHFTICTCTRNTTQETDSGMILQQPCWVYMGGTNSGGSLSLKCRTRSARKVLRPVGDSRPCEKEQARTAPEKQNKFIQQAERLNEVPRHPHCCRGYRDSKKDHPVDPVKL